MNYLACSAEETGTMLQESPNRPRRNEADDFKAVLGEA
jgi:hypothetical protein